MKPKFLTFISITGSGNLEWDDHIQYEPSLHLCCHYGRHSQTELMLRYISCLKSPSHLTGYEFQGWILGCMLLNGSDCGWNKVHPGLKILCQKVILKDYVLLVHVCILASACLHLHLSFWLKALWYNYDLDGLIWYADDKRGWCLTGVRSACGGVWCVGSVNGIRHIRRAACSAFSWF